MLSVYHQVRNIEGEFPRGRHQNRCALLGLNSAGQQQLADVRCERDVELPKQRVDLDPLQQQELVDHFASRQQDADDEVFLRQTRPRTMRELALALLGHQPGDVEHPLGGSVVELHHSRRRSHGVLRALEHGQDGLRVQQRDAVEADGRQLMGVGGADRVEVVTGVDAGLTQHVVDAKRTLFKPVCPDDPGQCCVMRH